jgi:hypothetical protein
MRSHSTRRKRIAGAGRLTPMIKESVLFRNDRIAIDVRDEHG